MDIVLNGNGLNQKEPSQKNVNCWTHVENGSLNELTIFTFHNKIYFTENFQGFPRLLGGEENLRCIKSNQHEKPVIR